MTDLTRPSPVEPRDRIAGRGLVCTLALAVFLGQAPAGLEAQERGGTAAVSAGAVLGLLVGDDSDFLDGGIGSWAAVRWQSGSSGFGLAGTLTWLPLDEDSDGLTGARANNAFIAVLAGPTLSAELGPVRPWVGLLGGAVAVRSTRETEAQVVHATDAAFGWWGGGGLAFPMGRSVALEVEAGLTGTGTLAFARAPALDGQAPTGLLWRDVTLLSLRLGVRIEL
jgi:hypothetical protein